MFRLATSDGFVARQWTASMYPAWSSADRVCHSFRTGGFVQLDFNLSGDVDDAEATADKEKILTRVGMSMLSVVVLLGCDLV